MANDNMTSRGGSRDEITMTSRGGSRDESITTLNLEESSLGDGRWVSILDYAATNGVSLSTLRRYIKAGKIPYRMEKGRYLLWIGPASHDVASQSERRSSSIGLLRSRNNQSQPSAVPKYEDEKSQSGSEIEKMLRSRVNELENDLRGAAEELTELKMLVAIYEEKLLGESQD